MQPRRLAKQQLGHFRHGVDDVLAIVEHQQQVLVGQEGAEVREAGVGIDRDLERHGDRLGQARGIGGRGAKVHSDDAVLERLLEFLHDRKRHGRLADSPGARDGDEPAARYALDQCRDFAAAADQARQGRGPRPVVRRFDRLRQRRDQPVAAPAHIGDVLRRIRRIAEHLAKRRDVNPKVGLLDEGFGPNPRDQRFLADQLATLFDQCDEERQGAAADTHRLAGAVQLMLLGIERERSELDTLANRNGPGGSARARAHSHVIALRGEGRAGGRLDQPA